LPTNGGVEESPAPCAGRPHSPRGASLEPEFAIFLPFFCSFTSPYSSPTQYPTYSFLPKAAISFRVRDGPEGSSSASPHDFMRAPKNVAVSVAAAGL
jgi:hypothetical protein